MPRPNTTFELSIEDLDVIETALRERKRALNDAGDQVGSAQTRDIHDLLGRLHNQKVFYRPRGGAYVSG